MNGRDDDDFRLRPGPPRERPRAEPKFVSQVLKEVNKGGGRSVRRSAARPGARLGRGHVAARFAGRGLPPNARRATVKTRLVNLQRAGPRSTATHLRYIEREGVGRNGEPGHSYGPDTDDADLGAFKERSQDDRHQFRLIVSSEDAEQLGDLHGFTRQPMARVEADLGTRLDWVAVDHWNTGNPHTHIVVRGKDQIGRDLIISRDYIAYGMRERTRELATEWLGPRSEREIQQTLQREVEQPRWTSLDRSLQREANLGVVPLERIAQHPQRSLLVGRLQHLQRMGLAEAMPAVWTVESNAESVLRAMGERGDIIRTMQRAMRETPRELAMFTPGEDTPPVLGRVAAKGLMDELYERGYLVVDGVDGRAHYVPLPPKVELAQYPVGAVVEARGTDHRALDKGIADLAVDGGQLQHRARHSRRESGAVAEQLCPASAKDRSAAAGTAAAGRPRAGDAAHAERRSVSVAGKRSLAPGAGGRGSLGLARVLPDWGARTETDGGRRAIANCRLAVVAGRGVAAGTDSASDGTGDGCGHAAERAGTEGGVSGERRPGTDAQCG